MSTGDGLTSAELNSGEFPRAGLGRLTRGAPDPNQFTLLFWDDNYLNRWNNLTRRLGRPTLAPEATFEEPGFWLGSGYPTIFRSDDGVWRMLYNGKSTVPAEQPDSFALVAESSDGVHWRAPDLTERSPLPGRVYPHQVLRKDEDFHQWDCYYDELAEDPQERLKGLAVGKGNHLWTSPDGLQWTRKAGVEWRTHSPDPPSTMFWNHVRGSYVLSARPAPHAHPRRVALSETNNWQSFSAPELVLATDALDTPLAEIYGMVAFPYAGKFVGLTWIFHTEPQSLVKYWEGKTDCHLAYSYNGWHFNRSLRTPFVPNEPTGVFGAGTVRPHCLLVDDDARIRIYSSAAKVEHGYHINPYRGRERLPTGTADGCDLGALILHTLRLDGFYYLESNAGRGMFGTRALYWRGGEARFNVQSDHEIRVRVTDAQGAVAEGYDYADCIPFRGDALDWSPRWVGQPGLRAFAGQAIRLEVELNAARIYAIRGNFLPLSGRETRDFLSTGTQPIPRPGF